MIQTGKTVVVTTTNDAILKMCNRIYTLDDGYLSESYEHDDLVKLPLYKTLTVQQQLLKASQKYCEAAAGISRELNQFLFRVEENIEDYLQNDVLHGEDGESSELNRSSETNIQKHYSNDLLIDESYYKTQNKLFSICEWLILTAFYLINSFCYVYVPFGFVIAVSTEFVVFWPVIISIGILAVTITINILTKRLTYQVSSIR